MSKVVFMLFTALCLLASCQQTANNVETDDLSTPEKSWSALLHNLKIGNADNVKAVVTQNGFESLIKYISPNNDAEPFSITFQTWANEWSNLELEWSEIEGDKVTLKTGPESKDHLFTFLKIGADWKMEFWNPNE
ncbi:MAG: hypothetical protein COA99_19505 [Moraxellaceae bacterium]|nr:MAG: hypothetical protein COA99_19505 [Moraxellaceae bacterium]